MSSSLRGAPCFRSVGIELDNDTKAVLVAGDADVAADLLEQLFAAFYADGGGSVGGAGQGGSEAGGMTPGGGGEGERSLAPASSLDALHPDTTIIAAAQHGRDPAIGSGVTSVVTRQTLLSNFLPRDYSRVSLDIKKLSAAVSPDNADNMLEFFIVTIQLKIGLKTKTVVNFLTATPERFDDIVRHGFKGSFRPVIKWYQALFSKSKKILALMHQRPGDLDFVLATLQSGFRSTSRDVALWTCRMFTRLSFALAKQGLGPELWRWFITPVTGGMDCLVESFARHHDIKAALFGVFDVFGRSSFHELFHTHLPRKLAQPHRYMAFVHEMLEPLAAHSAARAAIVKDGTFELLLEQGLSGASGDRHPALRMTAVLFLAEFWNLFEPELASRPETETILALLKKATRDASIPLRITALTLLFNLMEEFAGARRKRTAQNSDATGLGASIYKTLVIALVDAQGTSTIRPFLLSNFAVFFQSLAAQKADNPLPLSLLLDPLIKQLTGCMLSMEDFDFLLVIAKLPWLSRAHVLLLLQFLGTVTVEDTLYGRVAAIPFLILINRFHKERRVQAYLAEFASATLQFFVSTTPPSIMPKYDPANKSVRPTPQRMEVEEWKRRKILVLEVLAKVIHLYHDTLNAELRPIIYSVLSKHRDEDGLRALLQFCEDADARHYEQQPSNLHATHTASSANKSAADGRGEPPDLSAWQGYTIDEVQDLAAAGEIDSATARAVSDAILAGVLDGGRYREDEAYDRGRGPTSDADRRGQYLADNDTAIAIDHHADGDDGYRAPDDGYYPPEHSEYATPPRREEPGAWGDETTPVRPKDWTPPQVTGLTPELASRIDDDIARAREKRLQRDRERYDKEMEAKFRTERLLEKTAVVVDYKSEKEAYQSRKRQARWDALWASADVEDIEFLDDAEEAALWVICGMFDEVTEGGLLFPKMPSKRVVKPEDIARLYNAASTKREEMARRRAAAKEREERERLVREEKFRRHQQELEAKRDDIERYRREKAVAAERARRSKVAAEEKKKEQEREKRERDARERKRIKREIREAKKAKAAAEARKKEEAARKAAEAEARKAEKYEQWRAEAQAKYRRDKARKEAEDKRKAEEEKAKAKEERRRKAAKRAAAQREHEEKKKLIAQHKAELRRKEQAEAAERAEAERVAKEEKDKQMRAAAARRKERERARATAAAKAKAAEEEKAAAEEAERKRRAALVRKRALEASSRANSVAGSELARAAREERERSRRVEQERREREEREKREKRQREQLAKREREKAEREKRERAKLDDKARAEREREDRARAEREARERAERERREREDRERRAYEDRERRERAERERREREDREQRERSDRTERERREREAHERDERERRERDERERREREAALQTRASGGADSRASARGDSRASVRTDSRASARAQTPPQRTSSVKKADSPKRVPSTKKAGGSSGGAAKSANEQAVLDALAAMEAAGYHPNRTLTASTSVVEALEQFVEVLETKSEAVDDADDEMAFLEMMEELTDVADEVDTAATMLMVDSTDTAARSQLDEVVAQAKDAVSRASVLMVRFA
ncbi:uncharacterized protein AMSG_10966 [Thecamonas trahens ATCC 50062]|uniref:Uncharacterized protein n=1 Tax=Thecamonas trahens ATCC 50062 TaxID=461836 RepID=A0A0L0DSS0_THETB|nr:hypothetical protein AMSG_10966 [Thecamonas trahens ATCC 50062]KNC55320.1 hypothetical protein AMSG_10966 [Thecamonas trahens ATCC 50062]|eukprot:XP_013753043.1 hypothetical protein AMSG_10966 [Thecamonas trahens ATCC 50062]